MYKYSGKITRKFNGGNLTQWIEDNLFRIEQELTAISGISEEQLNSTRHVNLTIPASGTYNVAFNKPFSNSNYNVSIMFWDTNGFQRYDWQFVQGSKNANGFKIVLACAGTLETTSFQK